MMIYKKLNLFLMLGILISGCFSAEAVWAKTFCDALYFTFNIPESVKLADIHHYLSRRPDWETLRKHESFEKIYNICMNFPDELVDQDDLSFLVFTKNKFDPECSDKEATVGTTVKFINSLDGVLRKESDKKFIFAKRMDYDDFVRASVLSGYDQFDKSGNYKIKEILKWLDWMLKNKPGQLKQVAQDSLVGMAPLIPLAQSIDDQGPMPSKEQSNSSLKIARAIIHFSDQIQKDDFYWAVLYSGYDLPPNDSLVERIKWINKLVKEQPGELNRLARLCSPPLIPTAKEIDPHEIDENDKNSKSRRIHELQHSFFDSVQRADIQQLFISSNYTKAVSEEGNEIRWIKWMEENHPKNLLTLLKTVQQSHPTNNALNNLVNYMENEYRLEKVR